MFGLRTRKEMKRLQNLLRKTNEQKLTRRMSGMLPPPEDENAVAEAKSRYINFRSVLLGFEGTRSTCCLNIASVKEMSRAAIIIFRGRILACVYGKRGLSYYVYGPDAFEAAQLDMAHPDSHFRVQSMSEEEALAAAAIFQGRHKTQPQNMALKDFIAEAYGVIARKRAPGCILVKDREQQTRYIMQMFDGDLIRFYSHKDGWVNKSYASAVKQMREPDLQAQAFLLTTKTMNELFDLTFSPSSVPSTDADKRLWMRESGTVDPVAHVAAHMQAANLRGTFKFTKLDTTDEHQLEIQAVTTYAIRESLRSHSHVIDPWR